MTRRNSLSLAYTFSLFVDLFFSLHPEPPPHVSRNIITRLLCAHVSERARANHLIIAIIARITRRVFSTYNERERERERERALLVRKTYNVWFVRRCCCRFVYFIWSCALRSRSSLLLLFRPKREREPENGVTRLSGTFAYLHFSHARVAEADVLSLFPLSSSRNGIWDILICARSLRRNSFRVYIYWRARLRCSNRVLAGLYRELKYI